MLLTFSSKCSKCYFQVPGPHAALENSSNQRDKAPGLLCQGEALEDMSLSSASSLDRNDTSEEFLDDFDNLGNQSQDGMSDNRQRSAASSQARLRSFLNETMDWTGIILADRKLHGVITVHCPLVSM